MKDDEAEPAILVEFEQASGLRVGLIAQEIEGLVELEQGCCQIVTSSDVYRVKLGYEEARERIWPDRKPA